MFRPLAARTVRWAPVDGVGLEHLHLTATPGGIVARSVVAGEREGLAYGALYEVRLDADWQVLSFRIEATHGETLALRSPEPGRWVGADGAARPEFDGCVDIDLSASPFTNTLPIRRLGEALGREPQTLRMLYVPFDTLEPTIDEQRYRVIEPERRYGYEAADESFRAEIAVDEDGLVTDYPPLFRRL